MDKMIGSEAPEFTLQNTEGEEEHLSQFKGEKKVVLLFFPLAFSAVCTQELCAMRDNMKLYNELDAKVIGISVDSFFTLNEFKKSQNLNFLLLSDFNKKVSAAYNVLNDNYFGMKGVSKRAAFVINREGILVYSQILEDSSKLPNFEAIKTVLQQNQ